MKDTMIRFYSWLLHLSLGKICLLIYGTILGMAMTSIQVVLVGDWPHEEVKSAYGLPEVQYAWLPSTASLPESGYRGDFLLLERTYLPYIASSEEYQAYLSRGGWVVLMDRGEEFSVTHIETIGAGAVMEVIVRSTPSTRENEWEEGKSFWRELFQSRPASFGKRSLFFIFFTLHLGAWLLVGYRLFRVMRGKGATGFCGTPPAFSWKWDVVGAGIAFALFVGGWLFPWEMGLWRGEILELEEGFPDVATIQYIGEFLLAHGAFPANFDFRAYSLPMDISFYKRTLKELPGVFFYLFLGDGMKAIFAAIAAEFVVGCVGLYQAARLFCQSRWSAFFAALVYGATSHLVVQTLAHGHMIYAGQFMLLPWLFWSLLRSFGRRRGQDFFLAGLILWGLISLNANVASIVALSLGIAAHTIFGEEVKLRSKVGALLLAAFFVPVLFYAGEIIAYAPYFSSPVMGKNDFAYNQMNNWLKAITFSFGMANGDPPVVSGVGMALLPTLFLTVPIVCAISALLSLKRGGWVFLGSAGLLFSSMGFYGPLAFFFEHVPLVIRAPARTFLPILAVLLTALAARGLELLLAEPLKGKAEKMIRLVGGLVAGLLFFAGAAFYWPVQHTYTVSPLIEEAYASVPQGARLLFLPLWGGSEFFPLSAPQTQAYKPHSYTGYSLVHMHEYFAMDHGLKDAFSPPTKWEILKETGDFYDHVAQVFHAGDFPAFLSALRLAPDLQYLLVYKKLIPDRLYRGLRQTPALAVHYENEMVTVFRVKRAVSSCAQLYEQAVFVLSTTSLLGNPILETKFAGKAPIFRIGDQTGEIPFAQAVQLPAKSLLLSGDMATLRVHYALPRLHRCDEYYVMPQERRKALGTRLKGRLHKRVLGSRWLEYRLKFSVGEGLLVRMREDSMGEPCQVWVNHAPISQVLQGGTLYRYIPQEYFIEGINEVVLYNFSPIDAVYIVNEAEFQAACMAVEEDIRALRQSSVRTWEDSSPAARRHILEEGITFPPPLSLSLREESDEHYVFDAGGQSGYFLFDKSYFPLWKFEGADKKEMSVYRANFYLMGGYMEGEKEFSVRYR